MQWFKESYAAKSLSLNEEDIKSSRAEVSTYCLIILLLKGKQKL